MLKANTHGGMQSKAFLLTKLKIIIKENRKQKENPPHIYSSIM